MENYKEIIDPTGKFGRQGLVIDPFTEAKMHLLKAEKAV